MKGATTFLKNFYREWKQDEVLLRAAALSFYTAFSLPALILIVLSFAGITLNDEIVRSDVFETLRSFIGTATADFLQEILLNVENVTYWGTFVGALGGILFFIAAAASVRGLQQMLNIIMGFHPSEFPFKQTLWQLIVSLLVLVAAGIVLTLSIVTGTTLGILSHHVTAFAPIEVDTLSIINNTTSYFTVTVLLFLLYFFLPARRFPVLIILFASIIVSTLLVAGTVVMSSYIAYSGVGRAYGVASSLIILLLWIYYAMVLILTGAEIIDVLAKLHNFRPDRTKTWWKQIIAKKHEK